MGELQSEKALTKPDQDLKPRTPRAPSPGYRRLVARGLFGASAIPASPCPRVSASWRT